MCGRSRKMVTLLRLHESGTYTLFYEARYALGIVDEKLQCFLLNAGRMPNMEDAQVAFGRMFDTLCTAVLEKFTVKKGEAAN